MVNRSLSSWGNAAIAGTQPISIPTIEPGPTMRQGPPRTLDDQPNGRAAHRQGKRMFSRSRLFIAALAATFCLASAARAQEAPAALVEAAKKEGRVVWYTSYVSPQLHDLVKKNFEKKYGIPVDLLNVRASELEERLRTEQSAGRFVADVIQHGQASITRLFRAGQVQ